LLAAFLLTGIIQRTREEPDNLKSHPRSLCPESEEEEEDDDDEEEETASTIIEYILRIRRLRTGFKG
jgi:hypothetical protein